MVLKSVKWESEDLGRKILEETLIHDGKVLQRESLRVKRQVDGISPVRFIALLTTDFDATDGFTGFVCPFCGGTERTSSCECAICGVRR